MEYYQINDLERLSGIKAHTIRIWEKRYSLILPQRTDTNIRFYDNAQLKKLLNVASLVSNGYKISKIAALDEMALKMLINDTFFQTDSNAQFDFYINDFIAAMLDFDEVKFNEIYNELIAKFDFENVMIDILYPFLTKTGLLWSIDESSPIQEHFASTIIKRKLFERINSLPIPTSPPKTFLLFLPADEWHEIGLLFAEYIIRKEGCMTFNLGQNVPFADLELVIKKIKPTYLLTFLISDANEMEIDKISTLLASSFKKIQCLISANPLRLSKCLNHKQLRILNKPSDLYKYL
jgi:DNA-binding transcriptional MerR regulator